MLCVKDQHIRKWDDARSIPAVVKADWSPHERARVEYHAMKIATFNINSIRGRLPRLVEWLDEAHPDVVCLQELRIYQEEFPVDAIRAAGYGALWQGQKPRYNGVAVLARGGEPVEIRRSLPGDTADGQARYLETAVAGIVVACIYAPNGNPQPGPKFDYKLAWLDRLIRHAGGLCASGVPVVLAGDFNVVPTQADIYATTSYDDDALVQPQSRAAFRRLLEQGWTDAIRARHPHETIYTYWDYMRKRWERNAGLRIDHLLLNRDLAPRLVDANVDRSVRGRAGASDHAPTWIEVR
jgi:exodeoxyribonuclease-3